MFSPYPMKYELKPHLRIQAQCKVLRRSFGANFPPARAVLCSARSKSDHFPTREQVVPHWGSGVRVFSTAKHIPRKEHSHIQAMYYWVRLGFRSITFQDTSFRDCPLVQRGWTLFTHLGSISQSQPNCYADFCLNCKKVRTTKLKMATVWPPFTTASRGTELNLVSLQMHVGESVTVYININTNFNILVTLQMKGQSGSEPLE